MQDLAEQDKPYYDSLLMLQNMKEVHLESMCLDFTATERVAGKPTTVELVPGGADITVTKSNLEQFCEAILRYRLMERIKPQLAELLLGFLDVVPEYALAIFDSKELEISLCGLPEIDIDDWKSHTHYTGLLQDGAENCIVQWFWEIIDDMDSEMRSRLLQFVTGSSGVPVRGFAALRGSDGTVKHFALHGTNINPSSYPRAQ